MDLIQSFRYTESWEDPGESGIIVSDPTLADPSARSRLGINSAAHPEAIVDGFYDMDRAAAITWAEDCFKYKYFSQLFGYMIRDQKIGNKLVDLSFNEGVAGHKSEAVRIAQRAVNTMASTPLVVDGTIGPKTLDAINLAEPVQLLVAIKAKATDFYVGLVAQHPSMQKYLNGWLARVNDQYAAYTHAQAIL